MVRPSAEVIDHVIAHGVLERSDRLIEAGGAQFADIRLRKILVFLADRFRHINVFNARLAS